jgi:hypothetical protein
MKINITNKSRRLETISKGDLLIFSDREESVEEVDIKINRLYTQRTRNIEKGEITEQIVYDNVTKITPDSIGRVYDWVKRRHTR